MILCLVCLVEGGDGKFVHAHVDCQARNPGLSRNAVTRKDFCPRIARSSD